MLPLFRRRSLFSPRPVLRIPSIPTRSLSVLPTPLVTHAEIWDPTQHRGLQPPPLPPLTESDRLLRNQRKKTRRHLVHTEGLILFTGNQSANNDLPHIRELKGLLRIVELGEGKGRGEELWHAYHSAKERTPDLSSALTKRAWATLLALRRPEIDHVSRPIRADWIEAKPKFRKRPRMKHLKSMMMDGRETDALKEWEHDHYKDNSPQRIDFMPEHLELGVKLYALTGNADRALDIMKELFKLHPRWNTSVMMLVFRVHTDTNTEEHHEKAWNIYRKMRKSLGKRAALEDYDAWFVGFLECRHNLYARLVFQDMIRARVIEAAFPPPETGKSGDVARKHVYETLRRLYLLSRLGTDILRITDIYLLAISVLPASYHSHIYLNWMASAIAFQAPNHLGHILNMMIKQNLQPATEHYNLLLKALLRTGEQPSINKAEDLGWRMVEEARKQGPPASGAKLLSATIANAKDSMQNKGPEPIDANKARKIPGADGATFALIMQHHADLDQWEHVDYLARRLDKSGISPNDDLMNVLISNHTRKGQFGKAWTTYTNLTTASRSTPGVFPNGTTIRYVWRNLQLALHHDASKDSSVLPSPRLLLAETVTWWQKCHQRMDADHFLTGLAASNRTAIIHMMLHCFSYTRDFAGSLVALHVLRQYFDIYPLVDTRKVLQFQATWTEEFDPRRRTRGLVRRAYDCEKTMSTMEAIYEILAEQRWERMGYTSDDERIVDLDPIVVEQAELDLLSEFIRVIMKRAEDPETVEAMIAQAKEEVGVPHMTTGDLDAFSVA
ncbi:unnamed protein product [Periconia digitata]|uniref:Pentatricopeptide repeat protein n=1 Tax=Periconia digitata TaxID=1303443 RepID=A0A9W4U4A4_9PLEO|nr:unnamed protein product [Periconia digitata]